ncbi:acyltransferase family protein [Virgibacillus salexigens]|uniref:Intercellular adhesion protein C n=1 Tax=Virgibacillus massiliensis TaxID=1462526 RepID=A0A024Q8W7_9BACI|nr:acyltransferase family protein [Virgibacillus massiliensis]CDQ38371.1 Intercellular adhesion protein C [Virgibacillus massiliensis]
MIKEWNLLRTIACLSIVLLHSSTIIGRSIGYTAIENYYIIRIILTYATPTFIVLSEIILSNRYQSQLPERFFLKRFKLIFLPFISFAIIDAIVVNYLSVNDINIINKIISNLAGGYEGYFILIIFQFYILHYIILKYRISVEKLLPVSITIMLAHLGLLNSDLDLIAEYKTYLKLPFTAWLGYFSVAFLIGKHYVKIANFIRNYKWMTLILAFFSIHLILVSFEAGYNQVDSRRIDIFPLSISISLAVLAWGQIIPNYKLINMISNFSLGIYLVHWQILRFFSPFLLEFTKDVSPTLQIIIMFIFTLILSMIVIKVISLLPFGKYIIGNTKRVYQNKKKVINSGKEEIA